MTSLQILEGNDWTGASEIEKLIQDAISKEERIQKEKNDNTLSCYCEPVISGGHKGQLISEGNFGVFKSPKSDHFIRISAIASKMGQIMKIMADYHANQ